MVIERIFGHGRQPDDEHWISIADIMAGLMVIFLLIAITYIRPIVEIQSKVREIVVAWKNSEVEIHQALHEEFQNDLPKWHAELDRTTLSIRFKSPEVLFDSGTANLKLEFQSILDNFFPRYLNVLHAFGEAISEIRIEGHTSSEWKVRLQKMKPISTIWHFHKQEQGLFLSIPLDYHYTTLSRTGHKNN